LKLDPVHDLQKTFRTLLDCTARPGTVGHTAVELERLDIAVSLNKTLLLLGLTLLDAETSFCVVADALNGYTNLVSRLTYARPGPATEAAFIMLPLAAMDSDAHRSEHDAILRARRGTLIDPHQGATFIVEIESILETADQSAATWLLSGPGIQQSATLCLCSGDRARMRSLIAARNEACQEFPLGIEVILVDAAGRLVCLPRSTIIQEQ